MCGHAGLIIAKPSDFVSKPKYKVFGNTTTSNVASEMAATLLSENQFYRGGDGFGLMALSSVSLSDPTIGNKYRVSFVKKVDDFAHKWSTVVDSEKVFSTAGVVCMHARKMTAGTKVYASTHPIHVDHITLMHNGSIPSWQTLFPNCGSDTIGLAKMLAEQGIQRIAETIEGAKTLVWLDSNENSLNFFKHSERPLYMYKTGDSYIYASEEWMVFKALDQYGLPRTDQVIFEDGYHYKYMVLENRWAEPVKYENPEPASKHYDYYGKKKVHGVVVTGAAFRQDQKTETDAGTTAVITNLPSVRSSNKVLYPNDTFAMQVVSVTDHTNSLICVMGSVAMSSYNTPPQFLMKDTKMFLNKGYKRAIEKMISAGMYVATSPVRSTNNSAEFLIADGIKGLVFCFDPTYSDHELDMIDSAATLLYKEMVKSTASTSALDNIRHYCEMLDGFAENKTDPLGITLTPHRERVGLLEALNLTKIPQV